ncbi:hypothetical protein BH24BAC1_BH24BAC1_16250 [soil metagenome]
MEYASIILGVIALLAAGLAYWNTRTANRSLSARIDRLKDKNSILERKLNDLRSSAGRSNNQPSQSTRPSRSVQEKPQLPQQPQPRQQQASPRGEQGQPGQQPRKPKENRQRESQPPRQREARPPREGEPQPGQRQPQATAAAGEREIRGGEPEGQPNPRTEQQRGKKFAIIPEDGIIRQHQLQQQPDSDSYLEVDIPADGSSNLTRYRFNLAGNHAFVIAQGIDRLENAFAFEKPANRQVSEVVLKGDGVLARDGNGWKIQEKAQIDFR